MTRISLTVKYCTCTLYSCTLKTVHRIGLTHSAVDLEKGQFRWCSENDSTKKHRGQPRIMKFSAYTQVYHVVIWFMCCVVYVVVWYLILHFDEQAQMRCRAWPMQVLKGRILIRCSQTTVIHL